MKTTKSGNPEAEECIVLVTVDIILIALIGCTTGESKVTIGQNTKITTKAKRYIIEWGTARKNDLTHKFCSNVDESSIDSALASSAVKRNLDKFDSTA